MIYRYTQKSQLLTYVCFALNIDGLTSFVGSTWTLHISRSRQLISKVEAMLVCNFMEKAGVFQLRAWSMISRKRGCFQGTTSMDF